MTQIIEVIVAPDGSSKIETKGFTGATCRDASRFIEQTLGQCTAERVTGEFYSESATVRVDQANE